MPSPRRRFTQPPVFSLCCAKKVPHAFLRGALFYLALAVKQPLHKLLVQVDQLGQVLVTGIGGSLVLLEQSLGAIREGASQTAVTSLVGQEV